VEAETEPEVQVEESAPEAPAEVRHLCLRPLADVERPTEQMEYARKQLENGEQDWQGWGRGSEQFLDLEK
jgi:hypothetical protein